MYQVLQQLARTVVEQSRLTGNEARELETEITMDLQSKFNELLLHGVSERKALAQIKAEFGSTEEIGQDLALVHRPWLRIPLLGELLYFSEFRWGAGLFLLHILVLVVAWYAIPVAFNSIQQAFQTTPGAPQSVNFGLIAFTFTALEGALVASKSRRFKDFAEIYFISYLPLLLMGIFGPLFSVFNLSFTARSGYLVYIAMFMAVNFLCGCCGLLLFKLYLFFRRNV